ncbi:MAG: NAD(+) diphosphatase [Hyphomicrobiales bacterium]
MVAMETSMGTPELRSAFTGNPLDRASDRRIEPAWVETQIARGDARFVVVTSDRVFADTRGAAPDIRLSREIAVTLEVDLAAAVFLGLHDYRPLFALPARLPALPDGLLPDGAVPDGVKSIDLRSLAISGSLPAADLGIAAEARSLVDWHLRHGFCANCGAPTHVSDGGWRRHCHGCGAEHFPRVDPVVIMLAIKDGRCLMGRQPRFPKGMYSALAGFVEPGETLEGAVRREIAEEAGIKVGRVSYHASQPWPFPSTLMIACLAEAISEEIVPDPTELEDCRWFDRNEAIAMLERSTPEAFSGADVGGSFVPLPLAVAHWLVRAFVDGEATFG